MGDAKGQCVLQAHHGSGPTSLSYHGSTLLSCGADGCVRVHGGEGAAGAGSSSSSCAAGAGSLGAMAVCPGTQQGGGYLAAAGEQYVKVGPTAFFLCCREWGGGHEAFKTTDAAVSAPRLAQCPPQCWPCAPPPSTTHPALSST